MVGSPPVAPPGADTSSLYSMQLPEVGPEAVLGIELNSYAAELAWVVIWRVFTTSGTFLP